MARAWTPVEGAHTSTNDPTCIISDDLPISSLLTNQIGHYGASLTAAAATPPRTHSVPALKSPISIDKPASASLLAQPPNAMMQNQANKTLQAVCTTILVVVPALGSEQARRVQHRVYQMLASAI